MKFDASTYRLTDSGKAGLVTLVIGILGLIGSGLGWLNDAPRFYHAWLTAFVFWVTIALGGMFFTLLHHLTGATWSVVIRRIAECLMLQLPWLFLAFLPLLPGMHDLYHWSHEEAIAHDAILQAKAGFLNVSFFTIRSVIYFAVWSILAVVLYRTSLAQDASHKEEHTRKLRKVSAVGMLLFAVTVTFAAWDWLMSLDPHWFSTIFGVYVFAGCFFSSLAFLAGVSLWLRKRQVLSDVITVEHYHDLGKFMFGFTIFWSYIAFAQYLIIWYGNVPEETAWYLARWEGSWKTASLILFFGHFVIPFLVLLFRNVKRHMLTMRIIVIWFLVIHWVDIYWLVFPTHLEQGANLSWVELTTTIGLGGMFLWLFWQRLSAQALVPKGDSNLQVSIQYDNH